MTLHLDTDRLAAGGSLRQAPRRRRSVAAYLRQVGSVLADVRAAFHLDRRARIRRRLHRGRS